MLAKLNLIQIFLAKNLMFILKHSLEIFFIRNSIKDEISLKKGVGSAAGSGSVSQRIQI
jgi:hypothetical protein